MSTALRVRHIYTHEAAAFEQQLNEALRRIEEEGGVVADIKYANDPATERNRAGGFGALVVYEQPDTAAG